MKLFLFLILGVVFLQLSSCKNEDDSKVSVFIKNTPEVLWQYKGSGTSQNISAPVFEINGIETALVWKKNPSQISKELYNGIVETTYSGAVKNQDILQLKLNVRISPDNPVVRFQYVLESEGKVQLTKSQSKENITYFASSLAGYDVVTEVRLSEYDELVHSYQIAERDVPPRYFDNKLALAGPILAAQNNTHSVLFAFEHGSQLPDRYLEFQLDDNRQVSLNALKGNYWNNQSISASNSFETLWFDVAVVKGGIDELAQHFRTHVLKYMSPNLESRKPYIFYNTWNYQERNQAWYGGEYLESMNYDRMMKEIDIAHDMGIDVFVLDVGWFQKTGDWQVSLERFPDSLQDVRAKLVKYNMKLGLWFNSQAAVTSNLLKNNKQNIVEWNGKPAGPGKVWGTEESYPMCFVSPFWEDYADELIRLSREVGVTYFKWDAIGQHGCNAPGHFHGDELASPEERGECYSFLQATYMGKVIDKLVAANPEAIVDFDVTEGERAVGLQFLASGKFFVINNGPYYQSFDDPQYAPGGGMGANVFVFPGSARARLCRNVLDYDKWIPSILMLTHYLPDDPEKSQYFNLASLILGQNGIWGDLPEVSKEGVTLFGIVLGKYKQIRDDITVASPVRSGKIGGVPEIHEKINPETGKGAVVMFFNYRSPWVPIQDATFGGTFEYITEHAVDKNLWHNENVEVSFDDTGRAHIKADFQGPEAKIIMFGVN
jgi:alpha-galactosidase